MKAKIKLMTQLLQERFGQPIASHRAGRFAFDGRYAAMLLEQGYRVDCSVTPGIDWSATPGAPGGAGGTNYSRFPDQPYFLAPRDICAPAQSGLLEVSVTIETGRLFRHAPWSYRPPFILGLARRIYPGHSWLWPGVNCPRVLLRASHV